MVAEADRLIANTATEAGQLVELYGADPERIDVVPPGVDTDVFTPGDRRRAGPRGRRSVCTRTSGDRLRRPDPAAQGPGRAGHGASGCWPSQHPERRWRVVIVGGESGTGRPDEHRLDDLAEQLGRRRTG